MNGNDFREDSKRGGWYTTITQKIAALENFMRDHLSVQHTNGPLCAIYTTAAGQSIPNAAWALVNYDISETDINGLVTVGANWKFTAPRNGYYHVDAQILFSPTSTWADGEPGHLTLWKNGVLVNITDRQDNYGSAVPVYFKLGGSTSIYLATGDTLQIYLLQYSGGALALYPDPVYNRVAITSV
jgi:hypothetical protein